MILKERCTETHCVFVFRLHSFERRLGKSKEVNTMCIAHVTRAQPSLHDSSKKYQVSTKANRIHAKISDSNFFFGPIQRFRSAAQLLGRQGAFVGTE